MRHTRMKIDPMARIAVAFARSTVMRDARLCSACVEVLEVAGAGVTVFSGDDAGPLCASDDRAGALEGMQFTLGEGPCRDAYRSRAPVSVPRFTTEVTPGWSPFVELAIANGICAVFAYPLSVAGSTVGTLTLYQDTPGPLTADQHTGSLALSEVLAETMLSLQDRMPDGVLAPELDGAVAYRAEIYQAAGMVSVQLGISTADALATIRAHAFGSEIPVEVVAADVVARRLRFGDDQRDLREGA